MKHERRALAAALVALALVAGACGGSRSEDDAEAPVTTAAGTVAVDDSDDGSGTTVPSDEPDVVVETFGDLPWPCGPAGETNTDDGSESGVTDSQVTIGTGDDAGLVSSPGLFHEMPDAVNALVAKCNELGGIHGREITVNYYDAAVFNVAAAVQSACDDSVFFLVGEGWAFDSAQEEIRLGCDLPAVAGIATAAAFANGARMYQGVPNPADELAAGSFANLATLFPDEIKAAGSLVSDFPAATETRDKVVEVAPTFGWNFVSTGIVYNPVGEADWTPFVRQLQEAGVELVRYAGTCLALQQFAQTAAANDYEPVIATDSNSYATECAEANADGAMDNVYMTFAFVPFEEAADNPATQDYLDLVAASGGDAAVLGMQAASSFLLWAQAAADCGSTLTRDCVLANLADVHEWTGGGLHATTDPGANHPTSCDTIVRLQGTGYVRVVPEEPTTFNCDPSYVAPITATAALEAARLDENRISQQFATGG